MNDTLMVVLVPLVIVVLFITIVLVVFLDSISKQRQDYINKRLEYLRKHLPKIPNGEE